MPVTSRLAPRLVFAACAAVLLLFTGFSAMTSPYWDSWAWVEWLRQYQAGEAGLGDLLVRAHNEHPYGLPGVSFIMLGAPTGYDFRVPSLLSALVVCLNAWLVLATIRRAGGGRHALVGATLVCLSLRSSENLLYGFQLGFPLTLLFGLLAIRGALARGPFGLACMAAALVAGSFCSAAFAGAYGGVLLALVAPRVEAAHRSSAVIGAPATTQRPARRAAIGAGLTLGILAAWLAIYLPALSTGAFRPSFAQRAMGLATLAGSPLTAAPLPAALLGVVVLSVFARRLPRALAGRDNAQIALAAVGLCGLGLIAVVAFGRGTMAGGNPSRYATFGAPLVAVACAWACDARPRWRWSIVCTALAAWLLSAHGARVEARLASSRELLTGDVLLHQATRSDDEVRMLNPGPAPALRRLFRMWERQGLGPFAEPERYAFRPHPLEVLPGKGARLTQQRDATYVLRGPGRAGGSVPCRGETVRLDITGISSPAPHLLLPRLAQRRFAGLLFFGADGQMLQHRTLSLEGELSEVHLACAGPPDSVRVEAYVYSPGPEREVMFRSLELAKPAP